jgi:hypothetical protein
VVDDDEVHLDDEDDLVGEVHHIVETEIFKDQIVFEQMKNVTFDLELGQDGVIELIVK